MRDMRVGGPHFYALRSMALDALQERVAIAEAVDRGDPMRTLMVLRRRLALEELRAASYSDAYDSPLMVYLLTELPEAAGTPSFDAVRDLVFQFEAWRVEQDDDDEWTPPPVPVPYPPPSGGLAGMLEAAIAQRRSSSDDDDDWDDWDPRRSSSRDGATDPSGDGATDPSGGMAAALATALARRRRSGNYDGSGDESSPYAWAPPPPRRL